MEHVRVSIGVLEFLFGRNECKSVCKYIIRIAPQSLRIGVMGASITSPFAADRFK